MRLNRYLATCGVASRRGADALIESGRVTVNGKRIRELATFVEPGKDRVEVDGKQAAPPREQVYLLLHKPVGVVTTARDPEGRPTVMDMVPRYPRVFPVGRLDQDTSGALLLTNDGDLAHQIQHPRYHLEKEYRALVRGVPGPEALDALRVGVLLPGEDRPTAPAKVEILERRPGRAVLTLILHEGRHRQVRRMLESVGSEVLELHRVRIGTLRLDRLAAGGYRDLKPDEVTALRNALQIVAPPPRVRRPRTTRPEDFQKPPERRPRKRAEHGADDRPPRPDRGSARRKASRRPKGGKPSGGKAPGGRPSGGRPSGGKPPGRAPARKAPRRGR